MQGSDILTVIAEISVALAGFSGIVVALRHRALESWPAHEFSRFRNMLELAAYSIFFALFPFLPYHLGASSEVIWSLSSFALAAGLSAWSLHLVIRWVVHIGHQHSLSSEPIAYNETYFACSPALGISINTVADDDSRAEC